jgi:hypothetical protein
METESAKPQTFRKVIFADGSFVRITQNLSPESNEPIIAEVRWLHGRGTFPLEVIGAILAVWQWHSDMRWQAFEQSMTLPGGRVICWRFKPQEPCAVCLQSSSSIIGKGLFDAPPTRIAPETAEDYRDALRRAIPPEKLAASLASLPAGPQKQITDKFLTTPAIRRTVKIRRRKSKP